MMLMQSVVDLTDPRCLEPLTSLGDMSRICPSSSSLRNSSRSDGMFALTFIENLLYANVEVSQLVEGVKEQC